MKYLILLFFSPMFLFSQTQIGIDIDAAAAGDNSGYVSISSDGSIVAIGGPKNGDAGFNAGHVRVFENISGSWTQIGNDITGDNSFNLFGSSVSISSDGSIVAIGAPNVDAEAPGYARVYQNIGNVWTQIGADLKRDVTDDRFGSFVSLSDNGTKLSVAGYWCCELFHGLPSVGYTRIYENVKGNWTQIGGEISTGFLGIVDVALSANGTVVAIASSGGGIGGMSNYYPGGVIVYKNISGVWTQLGDTFYNEWVYWGGDPIFAASLTTDGTRLAIRFSYSTRVYDFIDEEWMQQGDDIEGLSRGSISLSNNGNIIAIGGPVTRVYESNSGNWTKLGVINEEADDDAFGISLELSGDGLTLAVGGPYNDGNGEDADHVRVYDLSLLLSLEEINIFSIKLYPNPATNQFTIAIPESQILEKVNLYNTFGQLIQTSEEYNIGTSHLASGLYYVEVFTKSGKATEKIILE